jgi:prophage maintenance system killer protein
MTSSKPTRKLNYPTVDQVEELHSRILDLTGGEHGDLNRSNLEYLLEAVKDVGRKIETNQAIVKKAAYLLYNFVVQHPFCQREQEDCSRTCNPLPSNQQL